jgi:hypothetical protein
VAGTPPFWSPSGQKRCDLKVRRFSEKLSSVQNLESFVLETKEERGKRKDERQKTKEERWESSI